MWEARGAKLKDSLDGVKGFLEKLEKHQRHGNSQKCEQDALMRYEGRKSG